RARRVRRRAAGAGDREAVRVGLLRHARHAYAGEDRRALPGCLHEPRVGAHALAGGARDRAGIVDRGVPEHLAPPARPGPAHRRRAARSRLAGFRDRARGRDRSGRGRPRGGAGERRPGAGAARGARARYLWVGVRRADAAPEASRRHPHMGIPDRLARKLDALPDKPGVYLWKNAAGDTVYVGKAKSLRARVPSYFGPDGGATPERAALVAQIADLETIIVPNEAQALLLENNLIKEHKPRFNIRLTDDKSYPRIAVTLGEPFPRVLVVRRVAMAGARFFGPYTDVATLRQTLRIIRRIFTVRSCHWDLPPDAPARPCLDYLIERCRAPCVGYQSEADYRRMIDDVVLFLEGKTVDVRIRLPFPPDDLASLTELAPAVDWHVPQRGSDAKLAELADQNARYLLDGLKIESFDIDERSADPVFALGRDLGLAAVPRAFVCID